MFTFLDGLVLETVEHLTPEKLMEEDGDSHICSALEERFPDKLKHDNVAVFKNPLQSASARSTWISHLKPGVG